MVKNIKQSDQLYTAETCVTNLMGNELVLFETLKGNYFNLDESGTYIWDKVDHSDTVGHLLSIIESDYTLNTGDKDDIILFLEKLVNENLLIVKK